MDISRVNHLKVNAFTSQPNKSSTPPEAIAPGETFQSATMSEAIQRPSFDQVKAFPRFDKAGFATLLIQSADDRFLGTEGRDTLEAFSEAHGDKFAKMETGGAGSIFENNVVFRVHSSILPNWEDKVGEKASGLKSYELSDMLNAGPSKKSGVESLIGDLQSKNVVQSTKALLALHQRLESEGDQALSADQKREAARHTYNLNSGLSTLHATMTTAALYPRMEELMDQDEDMAWHEAKKIAKQEFDATGGSPELERVADLMVLSADSLHAIKDRSARSLESKLLNQAGGQVLDKIAADRQRAGELVEHYTGTVRSRFDQTLEFMTSNELPDDIRPSIGSGGYEHLTGGYETTSRYKWDRDVAFDRLFPETHLLLGTEQGDLVTSAVRDVVVHADKNMGKLRKKHFQVSYDEELEGAKATIKRYQPDLVGREYDKAVKEVVNDRMDYSYDELTDQSDVTGLLQQMAYVSSPGGESFSAERAQSRVADFFSDLLPELSDQSLKRTAVDVALSTLVHGKDMNPKAKQRLVTVLMNSGGDGELGAATTNGLYEIGELGAIDKVIQNLEHADATVRRRAMSLLSSSTKIIHGQEADSFFRLKTALKDPTAQLHIQANVVGAVPVLEKFLEDGDSVWNQIGAARVLAGNGMESPEGIDKMIALATDDGASVRYSERTTSEKNPMLRASALEILGMFGSRAKDSLPFLEELATQGAEAQSLVDQIKLRREENGDYHSQSDPAMRVLMETFLEKAAKPGNDAERHLEFLRDPNSPKPEDVERYSRDDYPFASHYIHAAAQVGQSAASAIESIREAEG